MKVKTTLLVLGRHYNYKYPTNVFLYSKTKLVNEDGADFSCINDYVFYKERKTETIPNIY